MVGSRKGRQDFSDGTVGDRVDTREGLTFCMFVYLPCKTADTQDALHLRSSGALTMRYYSVPGPASCFPFFSHVAIFSPDQIFMRRKYPEFGSCAVCMASWVAISLISHYPSRLAREGRSRPRLEAALQLPVKISLHHQ